MMPGEYEDLSITVGWLKGSMTQLSEQVRLLAQEQRHSANNLRQSMAILTSRIDRINGPDEDTEDRIRMLEDTNLTLATEHKLRQRIERFVCAILGGGVVALINLLKEHLR